MDSTELAPAQTASATETIVHYANKFATWMDREKEDLDYKLHLFESAQQNLENRQMKLFSRMAEDQRNFQKEIRAIEKETTSLGHKIERNDAKQTQMLNESKLTFNHKLEMLHQLQQQKMQDLAALEEIRSLKLENKLEISMVKQQQIKKQLNTMIENEKLNREKQMDMTVETLRQNMQSIEATFKLRLDSLKLYLETKMDMSNLHQQQMAKEINAVLHDKTSSGQNNVEITQQPQQDMVRDQLQLKEQLIAITDALNGLRKEEDISLRNQTETWNAQIRKLDEDIRTLETNIIDKLEITGQQQKQMVTHIGKLENGSQEQQRLIREELNILTSTIRTLKSENVKMKKRFKWFIVAVVVFVFFVCVTQVKF